MKVSSLVFLAGLIVFQNAHASLEMELECKTTYKELAFTQKVKIPADGYGSFSTPLAKVRLGFDRTDILKCPFQSEIPVGDCRENIRRDTKRRSTYSQYIVVELKVKNHDAPICCNILTEEKNSDFTRLRKANNFFHVSGFLNESLLSIKCKQIENPNKS